MEQDKQLKEILLNSAETASSGFTDNVMQKVNGITAAPVYYQPLVSPQLTRVFVFIFGALIAAITGLCLVIALTDLQVVTWIRNTGLPALNYNAIFLFILTFWIVFAINALIEKKYFFRGRSPLQG